MENKVEITLLITALTLSLNLTINLTLTDPWMENSVRCNYCPSWTQNNIYANIAVKQKSKVIVAFK